MAAELIACGLQPRLFPGRHPAYRELLARYRTDLDFRTTVDAVAAGLGLQVSSASELGLYLLARPGTPFAYTLASWRRERGSSSFEDRLLHGLAVVGIAAYFYPQARDLEAERHRRASVSEVESFLRSAAAEVAARSEGRGDAESLEHEQACRIYLRQKEIVGTADGRRTQRGTVNVVARAFEFLADQGLVRRVSDEGPDPVYQPLERMRLQVATIAGFTVFEEFARLRRAGPAPDAAGGDAPGVPAPAAAGGPVAPAPGGARESAG